MATLVLAALGSPAQAQSLFGFDLRGSFGENGFDRYVPPVTMFVLNETPFITTEVKPIYAYHNIPDGFITQGGDVNAVAVQGRLALGDRLGIIATTDGWADVDFETTLPDATGFLDLAAGVKYAFYSVPEDGEIITAGIRYTAPIGGVDTAGIDLNGNGSGFLNTFVTAAKLWDKTQVQGTAGFQWGLSDENWSYIHTHGHVDYEITPGVFPLMEFNLLIPVDGGDQIPGANLTGADIFDLGAGNPDAIFTVAGGVRLRPLDNLIFGVAVEGNLPDLSGMATSVYGWRVTTDLTIHF
ncbi:MAG: hypothetical protein AAGE80_01740 [Pseudomonadota bacterium]